MNYVKKREMIGVIDTFIYNGEPVAALRLKLLYPHVTKFVVVEARQTHTGHVKPELFTERHADVFAPYIDKIKFIIIDKFPEPASAVVSKSWIRENYQRDIALEYITHTFSEYILMACDVDEIPSPDVVAALPSRYFGLEYPTSFEMQFFYYNFGWKKKNMWYHAFCINDIGIRKASSTLSNLRGNSSLYIPNAGWHASYFLSVGELVRKIESFAHTEFDLAKFKHAGHIRECFATGKDIFARGNGENLIAFDPAYLPQELRDFHSQIVFLQKYS